MTLAMKDLVRMPYAGSFSQHALSHEPFDTLEPELVVKIHERIIRAAGFVARDFRIDDTVTPVYGWQTCRRLGKIDPIFWSYWLFGQEHPVDAKFRYSNLSAALRLEDWASAAKHRDRERHCPLIMADLGPLAVGNQTRISAQQLKELAENWSEAAPLLTENTRLEAFFCEWDGRAYLLTIPLFLHNIKYDDVVKAAQITIMSICGIYVQTENDHVTLWHIGNFQNIDYVPERRQA